jgi:hypothetical protein
MRGASSTKKPVQYSTCNLYLTSAAVIKCCQYVEAMRKVYDKYPSNDDISGMYAEAIMNLSPWNVFEKDPTTQEVVMNENSLLAYSILSKALYPNEPMPLAISQINALGTKSSSGNHPLLLHLWIHLLESGPAPYVQAAERQADLLWTLSAEPTGRKLGHLLHM